MTTTVPAERARGAAEHSPAVVARGLTRRHGRVNAVENLDLTVHRGEVYGFLGPNGAGKTTTLRMLLGLVRPTGGTARVRWGLAGLLAGP